MQHRAQRSTTLSTGPTPSTGSTVYSRPITVSTSETFQAVALAAGYSQGGVGLGTYTINLPPPAFTISGTAVTVSKGATTANTSTVSIQPVNGFTRSVALTASITSQPSGAKYIP